MDYTSKKLKNWAFTSSKGCLMPREDVMDNAQGRSDFLYPRSHRSSYYSNVKAEQTFGQRVIISRLGTGRK